MTELPFIQALRSTAAEIGALMRAEFKLAQAETTEKIEQVQAGLLWLLSGILALTVAAFVLVQAAINWLAELTGQPAATLAFGLLFLFAGIVMFKIGRRSLSVDNLRPHRTISAVQRTISDLTENNG